VLQNPPHPVKGSLIRITIARHESDGAITGSRHRYTEIKIDTVDGGALITADEGKSPYISVSAHGFGFLHSDADQLFSLASSEAIVIQGSHYFPGTFSYEMEIDGESTSPETVSEPS